MVDTTKCTNTYCVMQEYCRRKTDKTNEFRQSFQKFKPLDNDVVNFDCEFFRPNTPKNLTKK